MTSLELKERLMRRQTVLGSWITLAHPSIPEIMANAGFDFLVIDMEHSVIELSDAQRLIQSIEAQGIVPFVRIGEINSNLIKRVLDAGACGIIAPLVKNAEDVKKVVQASYYPPKGGRGVGLARAQKYGFGFESYKIRQKDEIIIVALIEHIQAIENLESILEVQDLDATMIGPYDLSGSLGFPGEYDRPEVKSAIKRYEQICNNKKKAMGFHIVKPEAERTAQYIKKGYSFVVVGLDTLYLGLKCQEVMQEIAKTENDETLSALRRT